jgi:hypothetical protein
MEMIIGIDYAFLLVARRVSAWTIEVGFLASVVITVYSCGTALDFHQFPPLYPGIRAIGIPQYKF